MRQASVAVFCSGGLRVEGVGGWCSFRWSRHALGGYGWRVVVVGCDQVVAGGVKKGGRELLIGRVLGKWKEP